MRLVEPARRGAAMGVNSIVIAAVAGVAGLAAFAARQIHLQRSNRALLDLRPLANRGFAVPMLVLGFAVMLGTVMVLPLLLQDGLGRTAMLAGIVLLPGALVQGTMGPFIGRICDRIGARPLVIPATLALIVAELWMLTIGATTPIWLVVCMFAVFSIGLGLLMTPLMSASLGALPASQDAYGSASLNTLQQVFGASGTAIAVALLGLGTASASRTGLGGADALIDGASWAFIGGATIAAIAFVFALFMPKRRSVSAHRKRTD
ncbi:MFS transporter [Parenemella sanctibonifatiensis]|uniref:MFS transporter n=1 Tax=Parenemella sanctibonifatiensis TaxID=2016505 RepID=UPI001E5A81B0|nr:MFS transporter [Parenemella sanctibonifatiensis]